MKYKFYQTKIKFLVDDLFSLGTGMSETSVTKFMVFLVRSARCHYVWPLRYITYRLIPLAGRSKGEGLLQYSCWGCGFYSRSLNECLSLVNVLCRQVEVICDGPITRTEESYRVCVSVSECDRGTSYRKSRHTSIVATRGKDMLYRVSRGECARLRENVPYVKVHRYNPKHLRISEVERLRR